MNPDIRSTTLERSPWSLDDAAPHRRIPDGRDARADWEASDAAQWAELQRKGWLARARCVLEATILVGCVDGLFVGANGPHLLLSLIVGALVGTLWVAFNAETLLSPLVAMPANLALQIGCAMLGLGMGGIIWGTFLIGLLSALLGTLRSMRTPGV